jgi:hypothetical protein
MAQQKSRRQGGIKLDKNQMLTLRFKLPFKPLQTASNRKSLYINKEEAIHRLLSNYVNLL